VAPTTAREIPESEMRVMRDTSGIRVMDAATAAFGSG